jgi:hypothetical protein
MLSCGRTLWPLPPNARVENCSYSNTLAKFGAERVPALMGRQEPLNSLTVGNSLPGEGFAETAGSSSISQNSNHFNLRKLRRRGS